MTYMDVRFLVDDLNLQLKDPPPKADTNLGKADMAARPAAGRPEKKGFFDKAKEKLGLARKEAPDEEEPPGRPWTRTGGRPGPAAAP